MWTQSDLPTLHCRLGSDVSGTLCHPISEILLPFRCLNPDSKLTCSRQLSANRISAISATTHRREGEGGRGRGGGGGSAHTTIPLIILIITVVIVSSSSLLFFVVGTIFCVSGSFFILNTIIITAITFCYYLSCHWLRHYYHSCHHYCYYY